MTRTRKPGPGHNQGHNQAPQPGGIAADRLRSIIERIERIREEKRALAEDERDIFTEAKSAGYLPAAIRQILKERAADGDTLAEFQQQCDLYRHALGMLADTPLGAAMAPRPDAGHD